MYLYLCQNMFASILYIIWSNVCSNFNKFRLSSAMPNYADSSGQAIVILINAMMMLQ